MRNSSVIALAAMVCLFAGSTREANAVDWSAATDLGDGWKSLDWFGAFNDTSDPWIFHEEHGWMFTSGDTTDNMWIWTESLGWLWTSKTDYPSLYRSFDQTWIWYSRGSTVPRWFYNFVTGIWMPYDVLIAPAADVTGTWTTPFDVVFFLFSDDCGDYNRNERSIRWEITSMGENEVQVEWFQESGTAYESIAPCFDICAPRVYFPEVFRGVVSGSRMTLYSGNVPVGEFTFTSSLMRGTYQNGTGAGDCADRTDGNELILQK